MREEEYCCVNYFLNVHVAFVTSQTYQKSSPSAGLQSVTLVYNQGITVQYNCNPPYMNIFSEAKIFYSKI